MRINKVSRERQKIIARARADVIQLLLDAELSDLEYVALLAEVQSSMLGRMVRAEHKELSEEAEADD